MRSYEIKSSFQHVYENTVPTIGKCQEITDITIISKQNT